MFGSSSQCQKTRQPPESASFPGPVRLHFRAVTSFLCKEKPSWGSCHLCLWTCPRPRLAGQVFRDIMHGLQLAEVSRFRSQPRSSIPFAEKPLEPDSGGGPAHDCPRTLNSSANIFNSQRRGSLNLRLCLDLDGLCFQVGRSPLQLLHNTLRKGLPPFGVDLAMGPPVSHIFMGSMIWQARVSRL